MAGEGQMRNVWGLASSHTAWAEAGLTSSYGQELLVPNYCCPSFSACRDAFPSSEVGSLQASWFLTPCLSLLLAMRSFGG